MTAQIGEYIHHRPTAEESEEEVPLNEAWATTLVSSQGGHVLCRYSILCYGSLLLDRKEVMALSQGRNYVCCCHFHLSTDFGMACHRNNLYL